MRLTQLLQAIGPVLQEERPPGREAWLAMLLVSASTIAGAWLARHDSRRLVVWLALASATMLVIALTDLLPDAWREAAETGLPVWAVGVSAATGFLVITYFTRRACGHDHGGASHAGAPAGRHAPGRHRRLTEAVGAALFGGMGTAAALTTHRAIDGATLALGASLVVVLALMVHSTSEGLALAALLQIARQRLAPWLVVSCVSPAFGVLFATVSPLPGRLVPILLGMVSGVLLRTAIVGIRLAAGGQAGGRLSGRQIVAAVGTAVTVGVILTLAHGGAAGTGPVGRVRNETQRRPGSAGTPQAALLPSAVVRPGTPHPGTPRPDRPDVTSARSSTPTIRHETAPNRTRARRQRSELLAAVRSGHTTLADVLKRDDEATEDLRVGRLVEALPGRTPERATALMRAGDIDRKGYLGDLDRRQRRTLLDAFG